MMDGQDNRLLLERYLAALLDAEQEYALVTGCRDRHAPVRRAHPCRDHMKAMQEAYPGPPTITVRRVVGSVRVWWSRDARLWGRIYHIANLEFARGKLCGKRANYPILSRPQLGGTMG